MQGRSRTSGTEPRLRGALMSFGMNQFITRNVRAFGASAHREKSTPMLYSSPYSHPFRPRDEAARLAHQPVRTQGPHRARREEDRLRSDRGLALAGRELGRAIQSARQDPDALARGRHDAV